MAIVSERILVRGVNWLGDAVMTTPALLRLRESRPDARITLLTPAKLQELWTNHPAIDTVETFEENEGFGKIANRLRERKFEVALVLPNSPRSALEVWRAGIPRRIGYQRPWRNWFLTEAIKPHASAVSMHKRSAAEIMELIASNSRAPEPPASAHHIFAYLNLAAALGANPNPVAPRLVVTEAAIARFAAKFNLDISPNAPPYFGLNPAAEYGPAKRWPEDQFIEAAIQIQRATNCRWLVFGLARDTDLAARIMAAINHSTQQTAAISLAGATRLGELCAALKFCRVLLTNDSGPMHVAAALGTPVVVPFGSTSPELTGPGLPGDSRHRILRTTVPCSPCFLRECPIDFRCMTGIPVEDVIRAVLEVSAPITA